MKFNYKIIAQCANGAVEITPAKGTFDREGVLKAAKDLSPLGVPLEIKADAGMGAHHYVDEQGNAYTAFSEIKGEKKYYAYTVDGEVIYQEQISKAVRNDFGTEHRVRMGGLKVLREMEWKEESELNTLISQ